MLSAERAHRAPKLTRHPRGGRVAAEEAGFSRGAVYRVGDTQAPADATPSGERAEDLRDVFADTDEDDVQATSQRAQVAADHALDAMTGDTEWRALYLEFLAHAARDAAFRRRFAKRCADMRGALDELVAQRTAPMADALGMPPEQLALVIDALGSGLMTAHLLHGPRAVTPDLFSKTLALLLDGIAARAAAAPRVTEGTLR